MFNNRESREWKESLLDVSHRHIRSWTPFCSHLFLSFFYLLHPPVFPFWPGIPWTHDCSDETAANFSFLITSRMQLLPKSYRYQKWKHFHTEFQFSNLLATFLAQISTLAAFSSPVSGSQVCAPAFLLPWSWTWFSNRSSGFVPPHLISQKFSLVDIQDFVTVLGT